MSSIVRRFFSELPLRRLVILLGRLLPLLRSTATPGTPLRPLPTSILSAIRPGTADLMETHASLLEPSFS